MIIGLCGYAKVGKNTIADLMQMEQTAFADALKKDLAPVLKKLGFKSPFTPWQKEKIRPLYVALGAVARSIDPDFWIKRIVLPRAVNCVITDVRYKNEVEWIQKQGGMVFRINRPGVFPANQEEIDSFRVIDNECSGLIQIMNEEGRPAKAAHEILSTLGRASRVVQGEIC